MKHRRRGRNYYVVPYIFNDEGRRTKYLMRVPKGCRFLQKVRFPDYGRPTHYKGHKIVGWVYTYSSDSAVSDEYAPIISLRREPENFFSRLFRKLLK